jgi:hypothetical protein
MVVNERLASGPKLLLARFDHDVPSEFVRSIRQNTSTPAVVGIE